MTNALACLSDKAVDTIAGGAVGVVMIGGFFAWLVVLAWRA